MEIEVKNGTIGEEEKQAYANYAREAHKDCTVEKLVITLDGDYVNLKTFLKPIQFERIRRITGYLVGTLDRFNNGKRSEESDRVHHGYDEDYYQHDLSGLID